MKRQTPRIAVYRSVGISLIGTMLSMLPNDGVFCRLRLRYWRRRGYSLGDGCIIFRGVTITGRVSLGTRCSISDNCTLAGQAEGIFLGNNVMIAQNTVVVAFDHGSKDIGTPMNSQPYVCERIVIEDDVWIGANCTITRGVRIGRGSIVGANAVVTGPVPEFAIVGGVPARVIGYRRTSQ